MKPSRRVGAMLVVLVVGGTALAVARSSRGRSETVRPVVVTVLEAGTRRPLAGVGVRYAIEAAVLRDRVLGVFPPPESVLGWKIVAKDVGVTDDRGQWRTSPKALRLSRGDRLDRELIFVNLEPDPAHPATRDVLDRAAWECREDGRLCGVTPDATDALREVIAGSAKERLEVLGNPNHEYLGAVVVGTRHAATADSRDWAHERDRFRVQWSFDSFGESVADVTVELERSRASPEAR